MNFQIIKQAIVDILGAAAAGRFTVVGYQGQGDAAIESKTAPTVQVFFSQGNFPRGRGAMYGDTQHIMIYAIGVTASAAAKCNLAAVNMPEAPATQRAAALSASRDAACVADELWDDTAATVRNILMDPRNSDLGLPVGLVSDRWVDAISKEDPLPQGELVVLNGAVQFSCNTVEPVGGDTGVPASGGVTTVLDLVGDDVEKAGVTVV